MRIKTLFLTQKWFGRILLLGTMMLFMTSTLMLAQRTVTGTVTSSEDGQPLPGVNVIVQGTVTGAITSADGTYSIEVPDGDVSLQFSFIGFSVQVIPVGAATVIDAVLAPSAIVAVEPSFKR